MSLIELLVAGSGLAWLAVLFAVAVAGERRPRLLARHWAWVYALSLGVHCTSWTFYGTIAQAERSGWWLPPTFVGLILLYVLGAGVLMRLVRLAHEHNASSIADLIAARLGRHSGLAALVTAVSVLGIVPYIALQLKAVAMSHSLFGRAGVAAPPWQDTALYVALAMALFAMLFGTRRAVAASHNRGLVLALAFESVFKLVAMLAIAALVLRRPDLEAAFATQPRDASGLAPLMLLGALAAFIQPHQFHAGVVECRRARHVRTARWLFPLYLVLIALPILPLARAGAARLAHTGVPADLYVLALPLAQGQTGLAVLGFLGGLSAATSMVIVATLALSLMIGNHWIAPIKVRGGWGSVESGDLRPAVLRQRRLVILGVVLLAWAYSRALAASEPLAEIGALSFSALAGLMPALLVAVYRPAIGPRAVGAGLAAGTAAWLYVVLPGLLPAPAGFLAGGPFGVAVLSPEGFLGLGHWTALARAVSASLVINLVVMGLVARTPWAHRMRALPAGDLPPTDLRALAERFLPANQVSGLFSGEPAPAPALAAGVEHALAGVIGASSARLLMDVARRQRPEPLDAVLAVVDEASQDLRFNQRVLEAALENMSQGICVVDGSLRVVAWNRPYAKLFNYPHGLLAVGRPIAALMDHNIRAGLIGPGEVEARIEHRLGHMRRGTPHLSERWIRGAMIEIRGNPMPGGGYVATFTDVTESRNAERALRLANETLEQRVAERTAALARAGREKARLLAALGHDLAQPLHAAGLFSQALAEQLGPDPGVRAALGHLQGSLASADALLGDLLDISRLEGGGVRPQVRVFALDELMDGLANEFSALAKARGLRFRHVRCHTWVRSDPQLLRRVLQNFLANALRYTPRGSTLFGCRRTVDGLRIEVHDSGPGIPAHEHERIFEEFRRLGPADGAGLGLGLSIARGMARLLGHPLSLRSQPGRGSVFAITVPRVAAPAPTPMPVPSATGGFRAPERPVLVVDNDLAALAALSALLEGWGCRVLAARGIDEARAACAGATPGLLVLDYRLDHGETGLGLRRALGLDNADLPCIVVTADREPVVREAVLAAGCHLLHKPLQPLALKALLARLVTAMEAPA